MHALTVRQPYAELIVCGKKSIEVRTWWPRVQFPMLVAIHAGKEIDRSADLSLWGDAGADSDWQTLKRLGGIIGVARLVERIGFGKRGWHELSLMVGRREWREMASKHLHPVDSWRLGLIGWRFDQPVRFPDLIPCRGKQGLWVLPEEVARRVAAAYLSSPRADGVIRFAEEAEMAMVRDQAKGGR